MNKLFEQIYNLKEMDKELSSSELMARNEREASDELFRKERKGYKNSDKSKDDIISHTFTSYRTLGNLIKKLENSRHFDNSVTSRIRTAHSIIDEVLDEIKDSRSEFYDRLQSHF